MTEYEIRPLSENYMQCRSRNECDWKDYVRDYLGPELAYAQENNLRDGTPRLRTLDRPVHTLAITVGQSFEPLLQLICVLQPKGLVLILNRAYGSTTGLDHGETFQRLVKQELPKAQGLLEALRPDVSKMAFRLVELPADSPTEVFAAMRKAFQQPESEPPDGFVNAVDITGAKKSMVVGAFLYAAHSQLPITYVDFDDYHETYNRPYGYTCKIGQITDPYQAFQLRDWERVRQLYEQYDFRGAAELLGRPGTADDTGSGILQVMSSHLGDDDSGSSLFEQGDIEKVQRLARMLEMYEAWENGDYRRAKRMAGLFHLPLPPEVVPTAVMELGDVWPSAGDEEGADSAARTLLDEHLRLKGGDGEPENSIFNRPAVLLAYIHDELAKIGRLISKNEDFRSAYLRAAGLDEFLLKARIALCYVNDRVLVRLTGNDELRPVNRIPPESRKEGFEILLRRSGAGDMRDVLSRKTVLKLQKMRISLRDGAPTLEAYWEDKRLDFDRLRIEKKALFVRLRDEAIHTHLWIPKEVAEAAFDLVKEAVAEFEANWLRHFHPQLAEEGNRTEVPSWEKVCQVCGLDFLPPNLRR